MTEATLTRQEALGFFGLPDRTRLALLEGLTFDQRASVLWQSVMAVRGVEGNLIPGVKDLAPLPESWFEAPELEMAA